MRYLLLLCLTSCAASSPSEYRDGAPVRTPVAPPRVGHTPAGAGLPEYFREPEREPLPRSPHRRPLPPSPEPGIWAGDEPKAAVEELTPPRLLDVVIPFADPDDPESRAMTHGCVEQIDYAIARFGSSGLRRSIHSIKGEPRACLAAKLYQHCATKTLENYQTRAARGELLDREFHRRVKNLKARADAEEKLACTPDISATLGTLPQDGAAAWDKLIRGANYDD